MYVMYSFIVRSYIDVVLCIVQLFKLSTVQSICVDDASGANKEVQELRY